jgi:hypothetical protein
LKKAKIQASLPDSVSKTVNTWMYSGNLRLNRSETVTLTSCINPPPAVPWHARPIMSIFMVVETAQIIEVMKYIPTANRRIGLRPQISESLTHTGAAVALARR